MSEQQAKADELVEEGLQLYSQGQLNEALRKWNEALGLVPGLSRAKEYIGYVEENRAALSESFRLAGVAHRSDTADSLGSERANPPAERSTSEFLVGDEADDWVPESTATGLAEDDAFGGVVLGNDDATSRVPIADALLEAAAPSGPTHLSVLDGGGQKISGNFEPLEPTPLADLPESPHLVPMNHDTEEDDVEDAVIERPSARHEMLSAEMELVDEDSLEIDITSEVSLRAVPSPSATLLGIGDDEEIESDQIVALDDTGSIDTKSTDEDRIESMLQGAEQLFEQETFEGSMWLCQRILALDATNSTAKTLLERNRAALLGQYEKRLGELEQVPVVQVPQHEIIWHKLDHRAGFLLSRIDGLMSYGDLMDISGMSRFETCRILAQLLEQGVIAPGR